MMRPTPSFFHFTWAVLLVTLVAAQSLPAQTPPAQTTPMPANPAGATPATGEAEALEKLLKQVDVAIEVNSRRYLIGAGPNVNPNSPWQIFHGILALGQDFQVKVDDKKVSAINWIATAETKFDNQPLILVTEHGGNFHPFTRPYAFQGHPGQFLALLTQSNLPTNFEFKAEGKTVTISDMLRDTMMSVNTQEEITWVLWALNHYLKSDAKWMNKHGEAWSIERLVQIECNNTVENAACGGNHGLFALSKARDKYLKSGQPLRGVWMLADQKVQRYAEIARYLQNYDGTFSSNSYKGPQFSNDINTRLNTTGHTLEFLAASLPEARLKEPWVQKAVEVLSKDMYEFRHAPVDCGPLYHSLNALIIYRDRMRKDQPQLALKPVPKPGIAPQLLPESIPVIPNEGRTAKRLDGPLSALEPANRR